MPLADVDQPLVQPKQALADDIVAERTVAVPAQRARHHSTRATSRQELLLSELLAIMKHHGSRRGKERHRRGLGLEPTSATTSLVHDRRMVMILDVGHWPLT